MSVDRVVHLPHLSAPEDKPNPFAYFITVRNDSDQRLVLLSRKWILKHDSGEVDVFEGRGIVGQFPELAPGQIFSYNSYHVTNEGAAVSGCFFGETASGIKLAVRVPDFRIGGGAGGA